MTTLFYLRVAYYRLVQLVVFSIYRLLAPRE
jgi:hypothetical protein